MSGKKITEMLAPEENTISTGAYMNQHAFLMFIFVLTRACEYRL